MISVKEKNYLLTLVKAQEGRLFREGHGSSVGRDGIGLWVQYGQVGRHSQGAGRGQCMENYQEEPSRVMGFWLNRHNGIFLKAGLGPG